MVEWLLSDEFTVLHLNSYLNLNAYMLAINVDPLLEKEAHIEYYIKSEESDEYGKTIPLTSPDIISNKKIYRKIRKIEQKYQKYVIDSEKPRMELIDQIRTKINNF
jgi:hypothetical protein